MMQARRSVVRSQALIWVVAATFLVASGATARDKIDVITLHNGDRVTGEIKQLEAGLVTVKTDHMGTVEIEWIAVRSVDSPQLFEVEDTEGRRFYGTITEADDQGRFAVAGGDGLTALDNANVVRLAQIEESWLKRWRGYIDFGYAFASANSSTDSSIDAQANYRSKRFYWSNAASATFSDRADAPQTSQASASSTYERSFGQRGFWLGNVHLVENSELGLDLRTTFGAGAGRYLVTTARSELKAALGLAANRERYTDAEAGEWTAEGILWTSYDFYLFAGRVTSFSTSLALLPSLSTGGRYRVEFSSSFRRKLVRNFTIALSVDDSYDSKPPTEDVEKNDLRVRTTLGWSF